MYADACTKASAPQEALHSTVRAYALEFLVVAQAADTRGKSRTPGNLARGLRDTPGTGFYVRIRRPSRRISGARTSGGVCAEGGARGAEVAVASRRRCRRPHRV